MSEEAKQDACIVAVRIRGTISAKREARETLKMLRLSRNNYAVLIDNRRSFLGMLRSVQNYVTWGEVSKDIVCLLIKKKGRLAGNRKITDDYLQKINCKSLDELAEAIFSCRVEYWKLPDAQPVFRLHPPTKGFKGSVKKSYIAGGELGYRNKKINELVERML